MLLRVMLLRVMLLRVMFYLWVIDDTYLQKFNFSPLSLCIYERFRHWILILIKIRKHTFLVASNTKQIG